MKTAFPSRLRPPSPTTSRSLKSVGALPPNKRVQRTRSSASPPHSPLTRHPLGGFKRQRLPGNEVLSWPACMLAVRCGDDALPKSVKAG